MCNSEDSKVSSTVQKDKSSESCAAQKCLMLSNEQKLNLFSSELSDL